MTQRLFAAVVPPPEAVEDLRRAITALRTSGPVPGARWTAVEQWHVTLVFCAAVPDPDVAGLRDAVARAVASAGPLFTLRVAGAGAFPRERRARVLWAGLEAADDRLAPLATAVQSAVRNCGVDVPDTAFRAHLTLARIAPPDDVSAAVAALAAYRGPAWDVEEVVLVRSHLGRGEGGRAQHEILDRFALSPPPAR